MYLAGNKERERGKSEKIIGFENNLRELEVIKINLMSEVHQLSFLKKIIIF